MPVVSSLLSEIQMNIKYQTNILPEQFCHVFRDTAGQERFRTITTAYYRGAMVTLSFILSLCYEYDRVRGTVFKC